MKSLNDSVSVTTGDYRMAFDDVMETLKTSDSLISRDRGLLRGFLIVTNTALESLLAGDLDQYNQFAHDLDREISRGAQGGRDAFLDGLQRQFERQKQLIGELAQLLRVEDSNLDIRQKIQEIRSDYESGEEVPARQGPRPCESPRGPAQSSSTLLVRQQREVEQNLLSRDNLRLADPPRASGNQGLWAHVGEDIKKDMEDASYESSIEPRTSRECQKLLLQLSRAYPRSAGREHPALYDALAPMLDKLKQPDAEELEALLRRALSGQKTDQFGAAAFLALTNSLGEMTNKFFVVTFELLSVVGLFHRAIEPRTLRLRVKDELARFLAAQKDAHSAALGHLGKLYPPEPQVFIDLEVQARKAEEIARLVNDCTDNTSSLVKAAFEMVDSLVKA